MFRNLDFSNINLVSYYKIKRASVNRLHIPADGRSRNLKVWEPEGLETEGLTPRRFSPNNVFIYLLKTSKLLSITIITMNSLV